MAVKPRFFYIESNKKHTRIALLAVLMFFGLKILSETLIVDYISEFVESEYIAERVSYITFAVLAVTGCFLINIWTEKKSVLRGETRVTFGLLASVGIIAVPVSAMDMGFSGLQVYLLSFFSYDYAAALWDFEMGKANIAPNAALGNQFTSISLFLLCQILLGPLAEEYVFRGFVFKRLNFRFGLTLSMLVASLLFAVIHPVKLWVAVFISSLLYCYIFYKTGSLLIVVFLHGLNNLFGWLMTGFGFTSVFEDKNPTELDVVSTWTLEFSLLVILVPVVLYMTYEIVSIANKMRGTKEETVEGTEWRC